MTFGDRLKYLRNDKNLTQDELAEKIGLAKSTISLYESGRREPEFEILKKIASFFNITVDWLIGAAENTNSLMEVTFKLNDGRQIKNLNQMMMELDAKDQQSIIALILSLADKKK